MLDPRTYDKWFEKGKQDGRRGVKKLPHSYTFRVAKGEEAEINEAYETGYAIGRQGG